MKRCSGCKEHKETSKFYKDNSQSDCLTIRCKSCVKITNKASKLRNQEYVRASGRTYMAAKRALPGYVAGERNSHRVRIAKRENWPGLIWQYTKNRAKKRGVEFDIEVSDIVIPERCPIFGVVLQRGAGRNSPSIDRIDSTKGYVKGNIAIISARANLVKNSGNAAEHRLIADWIDRQNVDRT